MVRGDPDLGRARMQKSRKRCSIEKKGLGLVPKQEVGGKWGGVSCSWFVRPQSSRAPHASRKSRMFGRPTSAQVSAAQGTALLKV